MTVVSWVVTKMAEPPPPKREFESLKAFHNLQTKRKTCSDIFLHQIITRVFCHYWILSKSFSRRMIWKKKCFFYICNTNAINYYHVLYQKSKKKSPIWKELFLPSNSFFFLINCLHNVTKKKHKRRCKNLPCLRISSSPLRILFWRGAGGMGKRENY